MMIIIKPRYRRFSCEIIEYLRAFGVREKGEREKQRESPSHGFNAICSISHAPARSRVGNLPGGKTRLAKTRKVGRRRMGALRLAII